MGAVGFELDAALEVEGFDGILQTEDAGLHEIVKLDFVGELGVDAFGVVFNHGEIFEHEQIAQLFGAALFESARHIVDVLFDGAGGGVRFCHGSLLDL